MDFSLTTVFVVPPSNTLPSSGSTQDVTAKKFGVFRSDYSVATSGNVSAEPYIYFVQGQQHLAVPGLGTKRSDKVAKTKVIEWYKVNSEADIIPQVTEISAFKIQCGEDVTVTFRLRSNYIDAGFYNGLTRSVTVKAPCCACGTDPCTDLDPQATVDAIIAKAKQDTYLNKFLTFERISSGTNSVLRVTGNLLDTYSNPCDVAAYPHEYDRLFFWAFIYPGPETTQDFITQDLCDLAGTVTVKQRASYLRGSSSEVKQVEKNFYSYQAAYKHLFRKPGYNGNFESLVVDGTFYDQYVIKFLEYDTQETWTDRVPHDGTVVIFVPAGESSTLETLLNAYFGTVTSKSATDRTTTTTTSTTTTSTTSTTIIYP